MDWRDEGVVIGVRRHGETSVILELLTLDRGRHLGMVLGGRSRRLRPLLQPGNTVLASWRARLDEHMGTFSVEASRMRAADLMGRARALHALNYLCILARLLPERDPHPGLYARFVHLLDGLSIGAPVSAPLVRFELQALAELGFGLDLSCCAATGRRDDLIFVSPRSGRAVSREAGAPYRDRLLALPTFLVGDDEGDDERHDPVGNADLAAGFRLTEFFLTRDVFGARGLPLPEPRGAYLASALPAVS